MEMQTHYLAPELRPGLSYLKSQTETPDYIIAAKRQLDACKKASNDAGDLFDALSVYDYQTPRYYEIVREWEAAIKRETEAQIRYEELCNIWQSGAQAVVINHAPIVANALREVV